MAAVDNTYGALLIGVVLAAILYGCTFIQTWNYYTSYLLDRWYIKALVALVLVTDTCHQAVITHAVYTYLVTHHGVFDQLEIITPTMISGIFLDGFTTLFVQCFLAFRVYKLSNSLIAFGVVMIIVLVQFSLVLAYAIRALHYQTFTQLVALRALYMMTNATAAAADLIIALVLCALLHRSRTGFRKSDTIINKLIVFSLNTGLLTSICALTSLICITVWPHTFIYMTFYFSIGRLYCNSLLATLNARRGLRSESQCAADSFGEQAIHRLANMERNNPRTSYARPNTISIKVDTRKELIRDQISLHVNHPDPDIVITV